MVDYIILLGVLLYTLLLYGLVYYVYTYDMRVTFACMDGCNHGLMEAYGSRALFYDEGVMVKQQACFDECFQEYPVEEGV
jgi:hypothetical protein